MSRLAGLCDALVDDAAVFPPGNAPLGEALTAHHGFRDTPYEALVGPLLVPASAVEALRTLAEPDRLTTVALVGDTGLDGLVAARDAIQDDAWLELAHVELRLIASGDPADEARTLLQELPFTVPVYIELPRGTDFAGPLGVLAEDGAERAKLRCGPDDVPSAAELAGFLHACVTLRVPFKLTAGLHHALPFTAPDGTRQHGFVNTLAATWAAIDGGDVGAVSSLLDTSDPDIVLSVLDAADITALRALYRSFGSCSIIEPYEELSALQLVDEES